MGLGMEFKKAASVLKGIPFTNPAKGRYLYDFVIAHRPERVLELGVAHGVSTCYFAAALQEVGGKIDCVDLQRVFEPSVEELSARLGLQALITPYRELSSYTWFLKKIIEQQTCDGFCEPVYDLCFIDGSKDWTNDGCAFFLVDKLLKPNGWLIFDDFTWTHRAHGRDKGYVFPRMSEEELAEPHIESIFRLLVMQHPSYTQFEVRDDILGIARKGAGEARALLYTSQMTPAYLVRKAARILLARLNRRQGARVGSST